MSSDVPEPKGLERVFPPGLSVMGWSGTRRLSTSTAHWNHLGGGDKLQGPWVHPRNSSLSAQMWPGQLSVLAPAEDAGA